MCFVHFVFIIALYASSESVENTVSTNGVVCEQYLVENTGSQYCGLPAVYRRESFALKLLNSVEQC